MDSCSRGEGRDVVSCRAVEMIELLRTGIPNREPDRVRYHYVIADYLCRDTGRANCWPPPMPDAGGGSERASGRRRSAASA